MNIEEKLQYFNKLLYLFHIAFMDIRTETYKKENINIDKIRDIADTFEVIPEYMFRWDSSCMESIYEDLNKIMGQYHCYLDYIEILNMRYEDFLKQHLNVEQSKDSEVCFPQKK